MRNFTLTICISALFTFLLQAQSGCPGCSVSVPAGLPADTVYLPDLPDGTVGTPYDYDLSFRLPKTTNPVNAIDSTTPPGLTISKFEIISITGLPPGMYWQPNKFNFNVATETDGCIKFCGTPSASDSFKLTVTLRATVFFLAQDATFPMSLYIAPKVSNTDGFSMTSPEGCGSTTVSFTNNVPSNGASGFTYEWDFGDGSPVFTGENPPPHTYNTVGLHTVSYHAVVDTAGYTLESIQVLHVDCVDELGLGTPDLFMQIFAPNNGPKVYDSSPYLNNTALPHTFQTALPLGEGNYTLRVWDEDGGLKGTDDDCGVATFNYLSGGALVSGGLTVVMNIVHPKEEIFSKDTVIVYPQPAQPAISTPNGVASCADTMNLTLVSSYGIGNQWYFNGSPITDANDFIYMPTETGYYQTQIISQYGCVATSDSSFVEYYPLPAEPVWYNYNNSLRVYDTAALPDHYALQWYLGTNPIPGETGIWYCSMTTGTYGLKVTDLETGCTRFYGNLVEHNPLFDCTIATKDIENQSIAIVPNPASEFVSVQLPATAGDGQLRIWDMTGRLQHETFVAAGQGAIQVNVGHLNAGVYYLEFTANGTKRVGKLAIVR